MRTSIKRLFVGFLCLVLGLSLTPAKAQKTAKNHNKNVIGYFGNWMWYRRGKLVNPQTIQYSKYTHINYSFFVPTTSGDVVESDAWADENLLLGETDWNNGGYKPNTSIVDLAHQAGVKIVMAVGGWNHSPIFPDIAANPSTRQRMVNTIIAHVKKYKFDGVDMDWEYPGDPGQGGGAGDYYNFTYLIKELRQALNNLSKETGKTYSLSSCFSADKEKMKNIDWEAIVPELDFINLMTYDFFGAWDPIANHLAPLYPTEYGDANFCVSEAYKNLVNEYHIPKSKLNLGAPFYGRAQKGVSTLYGNGTGTADSQTFPEDEGSPTYYNIMSRMNQYTENWDDKTKTPYLTKADGFVSYENPRSIGEKAKFVVDNGVAGLIIWEITSDMLAPSQTSSGKIETPLVDKINEVFAGVPLGIGDTPENALSNSMSVYPNPTTKSSSFKVKIDLDQAAETSVSIYNTLGQKVMQTEPVQMKAGKNEMNLQFDRPGTYIIRSTTGKKVMQDKLIVK